MGPKIKINIKTKELGTDLGNIEMTLYTPLSIFMNEVAELAIKNFGNFRYVRFWNGPDYNFLDINSFPKNIKDVKINVRTRNINLGFFMGNLKEDKTEYNGYFRLDVNKKIEDFGIILTSYFYENEKFKEIIIAQADIKGGYDIIRSGNLSLATFHHDQIKLYLEQFL